jgi:hypothetical protein
VSQVWVIAIGAFNALAVFFLSILAVGGNGSSDGIVTVRWFGFSAIAVATVLSLFMCARGKHTAGIKTAAGTLPAAYALGLLVLVASSMFDAMSPAPSAFAAACKDMGAQYLRSPAKPVRSIAYDWQDGDFPPDIVYFETASNGHLSSLNGGLGFQLPAQIEFTEGKCCRFEGRPTAGGGLPYIRRPNSGAPYFGISELSADTLVMFSSSRIELSEAQWSLTKYEVTVSDRRTGDILARLNYMLDSSRRRGCGTSANGVMDERGFVLKAVGVQ